MIESLAGTMGCWLITLFSRETTGFGVWDVLQLQVKGPKGS